MAGSSLG